MAKVILLGTMGADAKVKHFCKQTQKILPNDKKKMSKNGSYYVKSSL
jgi:hypothetical protein